MNKLFIDNNAIELIKKELMKDDASAIRIFTAGGGCCKRFEIVAVNKALAGDAEFDQDGIKIYIEKELVDNSSVINIRFDNKKGLIIEFRK